MAEQSVKVMDFYPVTVADAVFMNGTSKNIKEYVEEKMQTVPETGGNMTAPTSKYKGLPWVIIGDSFTDASNSHSKWYPTTRDITGLVIAQNYGMGGMRFCRKRFETDGGTEDQYSIIAQLQNYDFSGAKVITISLGINDFFTSAPIIEPQGDYGSNFDVDTFTGAIEYTLNYIYTKVKANGGDIPLIVLSTPTKSTNMADGVNRIGKRTEDYVENMRKICDKWGLPLCEWISCGWNRFTTNGGLASDMCHPNAKGAERLGTLMADTIMRY